MDERTLCPRCTTPVPRRELVHHGREWICPTCAAQAGPAEVEARRASQSRIAERYGRPKGWRALPQDMRDWCQGRVWYFRAPFIVYFLWVGWNYLQVPLHPQPWELYSSWFDGINLGFHELGHVVFRPFGRFLHALGGTILQVLMPLIAMWFLWAKQRDWFGVAFCIAWLATNFYGIGIYVADARTKQLILVAPGLGMRVDGSIHDWAYLLGELGWLKADETLARLLQLLATITMLVATAMTAVLCWWMAQSGGPTRRRRDPEAL